MIDSGLISLALLVATAFVAGYFAYIYNLKRQAYLLYWTAGWSMLALLTARLVLRFRTRVVAVARQALRSAQPNTRRSPAQSAAV